MLAAGAACCMTLAAVSAAAETPDDQLRGFSTDRPNRSYTPITVDTGRWQVESDLANYSFDKENGSKTTVWTSVTPTLKLGLADNLELQMTTPTYAWAKTENGGVSQTTKGWTDLYTRLKLNLWGNDGADSAMALIPYVKWATGRKGISNGKTEYGLIAPVYYKFDDKFSLIAGPQIDALQSADSRAGKRLQLQGFANLSYAVSDTVTASAEYYWAHKFRDGAPNIQTADVSLAWNIGNDTQLDVAAYVPLNKAATDINLYFGISRRF
jgi:hypothetical protein